MSGEIMSVSDIPKGLKQITNAMAILDYLKERNRTKFKTKKVARELPLTSRQIGNGVRFLNKKGNIRPLSNKRWEIISFDLGEKQ
jgi:hypothetical protein